MLYVGEGEAAIILAALLSAAVLIGWIGCAIVKLTLEISRRARNLRKGAALQRGPKSNPK